MFQFVMDRLNLWFDNNNSSAADWSKSVHPVIFYMNNLTESHNSLGRDDICLGQCKKICQKWRYMAQIAFADNFISIMAVQVQIMSVFRWCKCWTV